MNDRWIVAWDFVRRPKRAFYEILRDEFRQAEAQRVQRSVLICQDGFVARRLRALAQWYGANVLAFAVRRSPSVSSEDDREAEAYVERIHVQRRSRRRPTLTGSK